MSNQDQKITAGTLNELEQKTAEKVMLQDLPRFKSIKPGDIKPGMMLVIPGSIFFAENSDVDSGSSSGSSGSITGHAVMIAEDTNYIIEAVGNGKGDVNEVIKSRLGDFLSKRENFHVIWVGIGDKKQPVSDEKGLAAARYAEAQAGKDYNWNFANRYTTDSFYCSQLCWRAWERQGYKIDWDTIDVLFYHEPKKYVSPNDIIDGRKNSLPKYKVEF